MGTTSAEQVSQPIVPANAAAGPQPLPAGQELVRQLDEIERQDLGAMWHCLNYGGMKAADVSGNEITIILNLHGRLGRDSIGFLDAVRNRCVPLGLRAAEKVALLRTTPELSGPLREYRQSLTTLLTTLKSWARPLPDDADRAQDLQSFRRVYQSWIGIRDPKNSSAPDWQYDQFLRCTAEDPALLRDPIRFYSFLWDMSATPIGGKKTDQPFFRRLRTTCLPGLRVLPTRVPVDFEQTHQRLISKMAPIELWEMCFERMLMLYRGETAGTVFRAWKDWQAANEQVRTHPLVRPVGPPPLAALPAAPLSAGEQARHAEFARKFTAFESQDLEVLWTCLFGADSMDRRSHFGLWQNLDDAHGQDPRGFPAKVLKTCIPLGQKIATKVQGLSPPAAFAAAMKDYDLALRNMLDAMKQWAEHAPQRTESILDKQALQQASQAWNETTNDGRMVPPAWRYDRFLRCAVPDLDQLPNSDAVLQAFARGCPRSQRVVADPEKTFVKVLRATCLPQVRTPLAQASANFKATQQKLVPASLELDKVLHRCLSQVDELDNPDGRVSTNTAHESWQHAGSAVKDVDFEAFRARP